MKPKIITIIINKRDVNDANSNNNQPTTHKEIHKLIGNNSMGFSNYLTNDNTIDDIRLNVQPGRATVLTRETTNVLRQAFDNNMEAKRSGDWLPLKHIIKKMNGEILNLTDDVEIYDISGYDHRGNGQGVWRNATPADNLNFDKSQIYIETVDVPLLAYSLYNGFNVIYKVNESKKSLLAGDFMIFKCQNSRAEANARVFPYAGDIAARAGLKAALDSVPAAAQAQAAAEPASLAEAAAAQGNTIMGSSPAETESVASHTDETVVMGNLEEERRVEATGWLSQFDRCTIM